MLRKENQKEFPREQREMATVRGQNWTVGYWTEQQVQASLQILFDSKQQCYYMTWRSMTFEEVVLGASILWKGIISPFTQELPSRSNCQRIMKKSWPFFAPTVITRSLKRRSGQNTSPTWSTLPLWHPHEPYCQENRDQYSVCMYHREREVILHCSSRLPG